MKLVPSVYNIRYFPKYQMLLNCLFGYLLDCWLGTYWTQTALTEDHFRIAFSLRTSMSLIFGEQPPRAVIVARRWSACLVT
jgi:hypothetical protein